MTSDGDLRRDLPIFEIYAGGAARGSRFIPGSS